MTDLLSSMAVGQDLTKAYSLKLNNSPAIIRFTMTYWEIEIKSQKLVFEEAFWVNIQNLPPLNLSVLCSSVTNSNIL